MLLIDRCDSKLQLMAKDSCYSHIAIRDEYIILTCPPPTEIFQSLLIFMETGVLLTAF